MPISRFFQDVDGLWKVDAPNKIKLHLIGSAALMLQADYRRGTKDSDVLETEELREGIGVRLLDIAGKDTKLHRKHRLYIDIVPSGLPFMPQQPVWHPQHELNSKLKHFQVEALDITDVVVSKLKRFSRNDQSDVDAMVQRGLVLHSRLVERFRDAVDFYSMDARADDLPEYVKHLHRVERDFFGEEETEIELPPWI